MQTKNLYLGKDPFNSPLSISRLVHLVGEWVSESIEGCVGGWGPNDWTNPFGNRGDLNGPLPWEHWTFIFTSRAG